MAAQGDDGSRILASVYGASTQSWRPSEIIDDATGDAVAAWTAADENDIDQSGSLVLTWLHSFETAGTWVAVATYDAGTQTWSEAEVVQELPDGYSRESRAFSTPGGTGMVFWPTHDSYRLQVGRYRQDLGAWDPPVEIDMAEDVYDQRGWFHANASGQGIAAWMRRPSGGEYETWVAPYTLN